MGAKGYLLKQDFESIIPALKAVFAGQNVFGDTIVTKMPELLKDPERPPFTGLGINAREEEIVALVAEGLNNKEIAKKLFLSEGTVRNYISTILEKLRLRDRTQLAIFYLKQRGGKAVDYFEVIEERRSIRKYEQRPIAEEIIQKLAASVLRAPSSRGGRRPWEFVIVTDRKMLGKLAVARSKEPSFVMGGHRWLLWLAPMNGPVMCGLKMLPSPALIFCCLPKL